MPGTPVILEDTPTEETRYVVYELRECSACEFPAHPDVRPRCRRCGGSKLAPERVAETDRDGLGLCLVTLSEEHRAAGLGGNPIFGVRDQIDRKWISGLWQRHLAFRPGMV